jgi:dihydroneopterin aldolase
MSTRIRVVGIRFDGQHGVSAAERSLTRRFEVDVELTAGLEAAQRSDRLSDTVDYAEVAGVIVSIGTGPSFHLLEALARRMVDALADRWPKAAITLEVRKLQPPHCPGTPAFSAVQLSQAPARAKIPRGGRRSTRAPLGRRRKR